MYVHSACLGDEQIVYANQRHKVLARKCSLPRCDLECVLLLNQRHKVLPRMCSLTRCHLERVLLPDVALKCVL